MTCAPRGKRHPAHLLATVLTLVGASTLAGCAGQSSRTEIPQPAEIARQIEDASAKVRQAQRFEVNDQPEMAIAKYREAIAVYNELPVAWNNLGALLMKRGENMEAANAFKTASELSPTDPRPLTNLGNLWESLGYFDDAIRWYDEALRRDEGHQPALRRYILCQDLTNQVSAPTPERLKRAILQERDPWWINRFRRFQQRFPDLQGANDASRPPTPPPSGFPRSPASASPEPAPAQPAVPPTSAPPPAAESMAN